MEHALTAFAFVYSGCWQSSVRKCVGGDFKPTKRGESPGSDGFEQASMCAYWRGFVEGWFIAANNWVYAHQLRVAVCYRIILTLKK